MRKEIPNFPGYEVDDQGIVYSLSRIIFEKNGTPRLLKSRTLKLHTDPYGYKATSLSIGGKSRKFRVYQLVARAFLGYKEAMGKDIDHINRNKQDDRLENLRLVCRSINNFNSDPCISNTSGAKGVSFHKKANKWRAYIKINNKQVHLGLFDNKEEAVQSRLRVENDRVQYLLNEN